MISNTIQRKIFWIILAMNVATGEEAEEYRDDELVYQVKQGIRSQRKAFKSSTARTPLDCVLFCFEEKTCKSFNYAEPTSVNDGEENCELHNEAKNNDENSLEFLKDDRYTFYQIPAISHESENKLLKKENVTDQAIKPHLNGSCLDHFNSGRKTSGNYTILDWQQKPRTVYCDMESEPGSVWTLIMSFTRENKDFLESFKGMYFDVPANEYTPNWSNYRMSLNEMTDLRNKTTHWRATCGFPQYGVENKTDYVRAVFTDFDLMGKFYGECKQASHISVNGQSCSECTARWWHLYYTPHIALSSSCDIQVTNGHCYFGGYYSYELTIPHFDAQLPLTQQQISGLDLMCNMTLSKTS